MHVYNSLPDQELIVLLKQGNEKAFTEIYDRFQSILFVYACRITKDENVAADIVQEVLISVWDKRLNIKLDTALAVYLYSAVRYKFFNLLDHQKVRLNYAESLQAFCDKGVYIIDEYIRQKEFAALIEKEVSALPPKMREVFEMSRNSHLPNKVIAAQLNISEKTVRNQLNNALKILRVRLGLYSFLIYLIYLKN